MIKFIYFDVGGVAVIDFSANPEKWVSLQDELGLPANKADAFMVFYDVYAGEICMGRDSETLVPLIAKEFGLTIPESYSFLTAFVSRLDPNPSIWPVVKLSKEKARIGLLTNMFTGMLDAIKAAEKLPPEEWDAVVDSSVEFCKKPDEKFYRIAEERAGVTGEEILFIDNTQGHLDAAKKLGWQTFLYDPAEPGNSSTVLKEIISAL